MLSWWVYERIVKLFAEGAVALSGRLGGAGLILRVAEKKSQRKDNRRCEDKGGGRGGGEG